MIEYIERSIIEKALQQAKHTMRVNENRGLSEAYIEAKSAAAAFQYVLDNLKPIKSSGIIKPGDPLYNRE